MKNSQIIASKMDELGITEPSHTFAYWKQLGFMVRKGEKAAFKCTIWKCRPTKETVKGRDRKTGEEVEYEAEANRMFMKTAHFFTLSQVEPIQARG